MGEDEEDGKKNCDKNKAVDENTTQHDNRTRKNKNESVGDDEDGENKKMTEAALMRIKYENTSEHNQINVFQKIDEIFGLF